MPMRTRTAPHRSATGSGRRAGPAGPAPDRGWRTRGITLAADEVPGVHLRLVPSPTALPVVCLGSRNGTTVNGRPLTTSGALAGDVLRLGRSEVVVPSVASTPGFILGVSSLAGGAGRQAGNWSVSARPS